MVTLLTIGILGMFAVGIIAFFSIFVVNNNTLESILLVLFILLMVGSIVILFYSAGTNNVTYILEGKVDHTCENFDTTTKVILTDGKTVDMVNGNPYYPGVVNVSNGDNIYLKFEKDIFGTCMINCLDIKGDTYHVREILTQSKYQRMCFITDPGLCNPTVIML